MGTGFLSRSSDSALDPLSSVLALLRPRAFKSVGFDLGGDWSLGMQPTGGFLCFGVLSGSCWLVVDGLADPVPLQAGEFAVLPKAPAFRVSSHPELPAVDLATVQQHWSYGGVVTWQGGGDCQLLSAFFTFESEHAAILSGVLPPVLHLHGGMDRSALLWCMKRMMTVMREPQPGSTLQGEYLAQMILLEALRLHVAESPAQQSGWLSALAHKQLSRAVTEMHKRPEYRWTVQELAEHAGMSRSSFAEQFKQRVGVAVMEYLTRWRMLLAADRLLHSSESVGAIALSLGYESESAFGFAFKREMGCSPRQYVRTRAEAA